MHIIEWIIITWVALALAMCLFAILSIDDEN